MKKVRVFARLEAKPGRTAELRDILRGLLGPTRLEEGCLFYDLYRSETGGVFHFHELWQSKAALERHMASDHFRLAKERIAAGDLLVGPPEVNEVTEIEQVSVSDKTREPAAGRKA